MILIPIITKNPQNYSFQYLNHDICYDIWKIQIKNSNNSLLIQIIIYFILSIQIYLFTWTNRTRPMLFQHHNNEAT